MGKWMYFFLLLMLPVSDLIEDMSACDVFANDSDRLSALRIEEGDVLLRNDPALCDAGSVLRLARVLPRGGSLRKIPVAVDVFEETDLLRFRHPLHAEIREDFSVRGCPRQRGYALVFVIT